MNCFNVFEPMVKREAIPHEELFWSVALTLGKDYSHLLFWLSFWG